MSVGGDLEVTTGSNSKASSGSVKTFRGRTIEEILPQVRSELGPDAIILREREGLVGGVGGFFAQRFIEVDARRGDGQSIDIYDDSESEEHMDPIGLLDERADQEQPEPWPASESDGRGNAELSETAEESAPAPTSPPSTPAAPRPFETGLFLERLREASEALPDDEHLTPPGLPAPEPEGVSTGDEQAAEPEPDEKPKRGSSASRRARDAREPRGRQSQPKRRQAQPKPKRKSSTAAQSASTSPAEDLSELEALLGVQPTTDGEKHEDRQGKRRSGTQRRPEKQRGSERADTSEGTEKSGRQRAQRRRRPAQPDEGRKEAARPTPPQNPYESVRPRPPIPLDGEPPSEAKRRSRTPVPAAFATPRTTPMPDRSPTAQPTSRDASPAGEPRRGTFGRLIGGWLRTAPAPKPTPEAGAGSPTQVDPSEMHEAVKFLVARGASEEWASQLISTTAAHGAPLAENLHEAAQGEVARRILAAPALPATGAAIAFIGAGGSGKTRCTAALASAYNRVSTLSVTVVALDNPDGADELKRLLGDDHVPVLSLTPDQARNTIETNRDGGFVIVDTSTCTPTDPGSVAALASQLTGLGLDAVYVALPATLGPQAARKALSSFGALHPTAVAVTHADETDQLAVVVEIATTHRIPLAYIHSGTDHHTALSTVEPRDIARHLLP